MIVPPWPLLLDARIDPKPWGGRRLESLGFPLPPGETIGEALITAPEASVHSGPAAGQRLRDLATADPEGLVGANGLAATGGRPLFPLLVKLIDAAENLSIQVHPSDAAAGRRGGLGKTEAWHVLDASPGAVLYLGLRPDASLADFATACREGRGRAAEYLRRIPAAPGTTVFIPAGTVHAMGAGVLIYEVQQQSEITYRLDDWGRVDAAGVGRELHLDDGLASVDAASRPDILAPIDRSPTSRRQLLVSCRYFALERLTVGIGDTAEVSAPGSPQVVTSLQGTATIESGGRAVPIAKGGSVVLTSRTTDGRVLATSPLVLLRTWVPDVAAEEIGPTRDTQLTATARSPTSAAPAETGERPDAHRSIGCHDTASGEAARSRR